MIEKVAELNSSNLLKPQSGTSDAILIDMFLAALFNLRCQPSTRKAIIQRLIQQIIEICMENVQEELQKDSDYGPASRVGLALRDPKDCVHQVMCHLSKVYGQGKGCSGENNNCQQRAQLIQDIFEAIF